MQTMQCIHDKNHQSHYTNLQQGATSKTAQIRLNWSHFCLLIAPLQLHQEPPGLQSHPFQ